MQHVISTDHSVNSGGTMVYQFKGSLAKGFNSGLFSGYQFTKHFAFELRIEKLFGTQQHASFTDDFDAYHSTTLEYAAKAKMLNLFSALRFTIGERNCKAYMRTGLVIGLGGEMVIDKKFITSSAPFTSSGSSETSWKYSGRIAPGIATAIGGSYKLGNFSVFGEVGIICQTWAPAKSTRIKTTYNGVDQLPNYPVSYKEYEFTSDNVMSGNIMNDQPSQRVKEYYSFSSIGVNVGLTYSFGKK